jgi:hypothetical protein
MEAKSTSEEGYGMRSALFFISALVIIIGVLFFSLRHIPKIRQAAEAKATPPDFSGIWLANPRFSLSVADPKGQEFGKEQDISYAPWGLQKARNAKPALGRNATFLHTNDLALEYADPDGYPRAMDHPMRFKIVQTLEFVYFLFEYDQVWRPVALNAKHSDDPDPTWYGESVGKWEHGTLVVDAIGFNDRAWLDPIGHPRSEEMHIIERWRRVDHDNMVDDITFDDPMAYAKPWNTQMTFKLDHSGELHENIYTATDELRFKSQMVGVINKTASKPLK